MAVEQLLGQMAHETRERVMLGVVHALGVALMAQPQKAPAPSTTVHAFPQRDPASEIVDEREEDGIPFGAVVYSPGMSIEEEENRMLGFPGGEWEPS